MAIQWTEKPTTGSMVTDDRRQGGTMLILIAEDDKNFGHVLKNELETDRHSVDLVTDGVEAVLSFISGEYDFLLLDIKMPKLDGINALRIIRKIAPAVPAIAFSGNAGSAEMAEALNAGAIRCLTKPFEIAILKEEIKRYGSRHGAAMT